ncbi:MAG TPA: septal ring lytic transglycosylase RlpA family protein [Terriglobales bacterium]|nr:septal ring lytic transglycosylase RlpA family protein [Terriglobales bacterium]
MSGPKSVQTGPLQAVVVLVGLLFCLMLLVGCGHKKSTKISVPPAPPISGAPAEPRSPSDLDFPADAQPIYVETGIASWYGPPYHNRRSSNGEIFDTYKMTAAHRTLPLNSVARVTNVKTGRTAVVRITDRGPFIEGRMLDLSLAAAKAVDVWRPGLAKVKLEVMHTPTPIESGGRWCVQIGAFEDKQHATRLKEKLTRRYRTARVLQFTGPTGDWLRIRVAEDDKKRAEEVAQSTTTSQGSIFLVRLD